MLNQKSVLARLLANENITVQQGNYETAFFDVETRVLGLPLWKDMGKDVFDMLVGHEIAHALFTPANFHEYMNEGIPHSHLNIVEDVRIEKKVLRKYPGLVGNFKRGYLSLMNDLDLFGVKDKLDQLHTLPFMDRLNLHAKARDLLDVPFADDELPFVAQAKACETYEDVVQCCRDIQAWLKQKAEDAKEQEQDQGKDDQGKDDNSESSNSSDSKESGVVILTDDTEFGEGEEISPENITEVIDMRSDKSETTEEEADSEDSSEEGTEEGAEGNGGTASDASESDEGDESDASGDPQTPEAGESDAEAMTDVNFNENSGKLVESDGSIYVVGLTKAQSDASTVPYNVIAASRRSRGELMRKTLIDRGLDVSNYGLDFPETEYAQFLRETKQIVNLMVKEFEMRKAAYRSARARTSTRGTLDVNQLHKYKYEDNLFKQVRQLADAKSHGMMMLIDYSGSMHSSLPAVIRQLLALLMFCKRVGIPFEVYSFTSIGSGPAWEPMNAAKRLAKPNLTQVCSEELALLELFNSSMSKRDYEEAFRMMFHQSMGTYGVAQSDFEALGNTPLNAALMAMQYKIKAFRQKHSFQKMNFVALTDGDSNWLHVQAGEDIQSYSRTYSRSYNVEVDKKIIKIKPNRGSGSDATAALVKAIEETGCTTINYFVAQSNRDINGAVRQAITSNGWNENYRSDFSAAKRDMKQKGCAVFDNNLGYNRRFILMASDSTMQGEVDSLEVSSDMTAKKIAKAFGQSNGSKKKSRVVTQKFAEIVA